MRISRPEVEDAERPLGVDETQPRLSWTADQEQVAYQVVVGTRPGAVDGGGARARG